MLTSLPLVVHVQTLLSEEDETCPTCGGRAQIKDRDPVVLADLPAYGR